MRGIYLSQDLTHAFGISEKINQQITEFEKNGYQVAKQINPQRNLFHLARNLVPFFSEQYFYTKDLPWQNYDFAYIRKGAVLDKSVINLVKKAKAVNPKIKLILEVPTYPYLDEFKGLVKLDIMLKEKRWTKALSRYIDRIVTYSDDQKIFDIPCINISNAYDFAALDFSNRHKQASINLLGVATLCFYHGYDRIIEGLRNYYQNPDQPIKVTFTLVGDGPVLKDYKKMVTEYQLEDVVFLQGRKQLSELAPYYTAADIGVDSLARHRSGVSYNSSLKGKEYLAKGLPIISGVKTDLDERNLPFYYRVPSDETPVDIKAVVEWYEKLLQTSTKAQLAASIFNYGEANFTFSTTFAPVIDYLKGVLYD